MPVPMSVTSGNESDINATNAWMRSQPWYQQLLASFGQDPNNVHLSKHQSTQVVRAAQQNGVVVDEGKIEVDPAGNFNPIGHKLRNTLIAAGIGAGAAFGGPALLGALGAGGGAGAGSAAALGPVAAAGGTTAAAVPGALAGVGAASGIGSAAAGGGLLSTLGRYAPALADLGQVATGAGQGLADDRRLDNNTDLNAAQLNLNAPTTRAQQVARGDAMSHPIAPASHTGTGRDITFSGGVSPSMYGADSQAAGVELKRQALEKLMGGPEYVPRRAGVGENIASGVGIGANVLSIFGRMGRR